MVLAVSDEDKKIAWKSCQGQGEPISTMKIGKVAEPSGLESEMLKAAEEAGVNMTAELENQIIVEGVIPTEWKLNECKLLW